MLAGSAVAMNKNDQGFEYLLQECNTFNGQSIRIKTLYNFSNPTTHTVAQQAEIDKAFKSAFTVTEEGAVDLKPLQEITRDFCVAESKTSFWVRNKGKVLFGLGLGAGLSAGAIIGVGWILWQFRGSRIR